MSYRLVAVALLGSLAAACATYETRTVVVPDASTQDSCAYYGYTAGTDAYRLCRDREAEYRRAPRMTRADFTQARVVADAQTACSSYGLSRGTERYERCVQRETAYRTPG